MTAGRLVRTPAAGLLTYLSPSPPTHTCAIGVIDGSVCGSVGGGRATCAPDCCSSDGPCSLGLEPDRVRRGWGGGRRYIMVANNNNSNQLTKFTNKSIIFSPIYWYGLFVRGVLLFFFYLNGTVKIKEDEGGRRGAK